MTKLWIASDLHHGWSITRPRVPDHEVFVCAGDFSRLDNTIETLTSGLYGNRLTVVVPGNHEYYGTVIQDMERTGAALAARSKVSLLNPGVAVLRGIRFVGCTLWTDYLLFGREGFAQAMAEASVGLNDHRVIRTRTGCPPGHSRPFTPESAFRRHQFERAWLEARLDEPFDGPTVVVSHHCPSPRSVPKRFLDDPMSPAFSSDLEELILRHQPDLWIHGHTHDSFDYTIGRTRVICNPAGYSHEPNRDFVPDLVVDLPAYGNDDEDDEPPTGMRP
ncbi:MAG TPA: metallophosphoesterase [Xanthobacteraceae bacterium]|nr:metallophosphoesterase [Xanthobacteraceae bacterium]